MGCLYRRGKIWWMAYMVDGRQHCESTGTSNKRLAQKILDKRKGEIAEGRFPGLLKSHAPTLKKTTFQSASRISHRPFTRIRRGTEAEEIP